MNREVPAKKVVVASDVYVLATFILGLALLCTSSTLALLLLFFAVLIFGGGLSLNVFRKLLTNWLTSIALGKQFTSPARRLERNPPETELMDESEEEVPEVKRARGRPRKVMEEPKPAQEIPVAAKVIVAEAAPDRSTPLEFEDVMRVVCGEDVGNISNSSGDKKGLLDRFKKE